MEPPMIPSLHSDTRSQIHTAEALLAVIFLVTVIMFVVPTFAISSYDSQTGDLAEQRQIKEDLNVITQTHSKNGAIKESLLRYDSSSDSYTGGATWEDSHHYAELPTNRWSNDLLALESEYNITYTNIKLLPASNVSKTNPYNTSFVWFKQAPVQDGDPVARTTTSLTLYNSDALTPAGKQPGVHGGYATGFSTNRDGVERISDLSDWHIPEGVNTHPQVYNTVTVEITVYREQFEGAGS